MQSTIVVAKNFCARYYPFKKGGILGIVVYAAGTSPNLPEYTFYKGTERLVFEKDSWTWYRCNEDGTRTKLYGVTGVLKIIAKEALIPWAVKTALARTKKLLIEGKFLATDDPEFSPYPLFETELDRILSQAKKADSEVLTDAGNVGHEAHQFLEDYVNATIYHNEGRQLEILAKFPLDERAANCAIAGLEFFYKHNVRFICAERPVYSKELQCCGTMDNLALTDSCDDVTCCPVSHQDSLTLIDYKTSNFLYGSYLAQTAIYQKAFQEETGQNIERRFILRLGKTEAEFESWHMAGDKIYEEDLAFYKHALDLHKSVHLVDERLARIRQTQAASRRAIAKELKGEQMKIKCASADKYKGVRKPTCNKGNPCQTCSKIYLDKHPEV